MDRFVEGLLPNWLINSDNYFLTVTDLEGRLLFGNHFFKKSFFDHENDFTDQALGTLLHPDDVPLYAQAVVICRAAPSAVVPVQLRQPIKPGDQSERTQQWEFSLFTGPQNQVLGILGIGHDITDAHRAEQQNMALGQKLEILMANITDGFYMVDPNWTLLMANAAAEVMFGTPLRQYVGRSLWAFFDDSEAYRYPKELRRAMQDNVTLHFNDYSRTMHRWFAATAYPTPEGLMVFCKDLTTEQLAQQQLLTSENKLRAILDSTSDSNVLISPNFEILSFNSVAQADARRYWHQELKEGALVSDYVPKAIRNQFKSSFRQAVQGETVNTEIMIQLSPGESWWFEVKYFPVVGHDGNFIGVAFNSTNIDKRKRAEAAAAQATRKLNAAYNSGLEARSLIGPDGKILHFNELSAQLVQRFFGRRPQIGNAMLDFIFPESQDQVQDLLTAALAGEPSQTETRLSTAPKMYRWYRTSYSPVYDQGAIIGVSYVVQDITAEKRKEKRILAQNRALKKIAWQQSHEVRGPLASIMGLAQLLLNDKQADETIKADYLAHLLKSTTALDMVIRRIVQQANQII